MLRTILNAFSVADIRKKLAFTAAMLALYRLGAYIPAPGVNVSAVKEISSNFGGSSHACSFVRFAIDSTVRALN